MKDTLLAKQKENAAVLAAAYRAWMAASGLRQRRLRNKPLPMVTSGAMWQKALTEN